MSLVNTPLPADRSVLWRMEHQSPGLHVAGLARVEGRLEPERVLHRLDRLRELPRFGLRIETPVVGAPRWRAASFEPERHFHQAAVDDPTASLGSALGKTLDPDLPLWEVHLLPGYHEDGDGVVIKAHLAMVDGLGTHELFETLFESGAKSADAVASAHAPNGNGVPAIRRGIDQIQRAAEFFEDWTGTGRDMVGGAVRLASEEMRSALLTLNEVMPDVALPPLPLPFNRASIGRRRLVCAELSYADVRTIRTRLGGALSDIVLAVVGGALERYLARLGVATAGRSLKVALATDVPDRPMARRSLLPIEIPLSIGAAGRLHSVHQLARLMRSAHVADALSHFAGIQRAAGPLATTAAAFGSSLRPPFHLTVANATGPQIPQYLAGRKVAGYTPSWPVGLGQGLTCSFFAYNQLLHVGFTVDERACPDAAVLPDLLAESLHELREAAGAAPRRRVRMRPPESLAVQTLETS